MIFSTVLRIFSLSLLQSLLITYVVSAAPDPEWPPIKEIKDTKPKRSVFAATGNKGPVVIRSEQDADAFFGDDDLVKLTRHVDFERQFVLLFAWRGSGQDRLRYEVLESFSEQVRFWLVPGRTRDLRPHVHVYALRLNVKWKLRGAAADDAQSNKLSYVMLTEGIVGGFVPAHVRQRIMVVDHDEKYELLLMRQATRGDEPSFERATLTAAQFNSLVTSITSKGLFELPVESPLGCEDIYKLDTSLAVRKGKSYWRNGGPAGCVRGQSTVQPTDKQQQNFRAVVEMVKRFTDELAKTPSYAKTINATLQQIHRDAPTGKATRLD